MKITTSKQLTKISETGPEAAKPGVEGFVKISPNKRKKITSKQLVNTVMSRPWVVKLENQGFVDGCPRENNRLQTAGH